LEGLLLLLDFVAAGLGKPGRAVEYTRLPTLVFN
jgi:hypothetical protein